MEKMNQARILIVEDEKGIVDNISYALKTEGFETHWSGTGGEALAALDNLDFNLVILDVGLPDVNGFDLFKKLRRESRVPVIFLTARSDEIDRVVGLELGADDYVTKPFSPRELAARVKAVLRRSGGHNASRTTEGGDQESENFPFHCDTRRNSITFFGQVVKLSRYEYRILKIMIEHPGWVYSREQLMELAWEEPDMSLVRTVDAHIKNVRQKLKAIRSDCEPIITHHGSGYALNEDW